MSDDLTEALQAEIDALRQQVEQLDAAAIEYRRQMAVVLTSASWRLTSPLRAVADRARLARRRVRQLAHRSRLRRGRPQKPQVAGLFKPTAPPADSLATSDSPLLAKPYRAVSPSRPPASPDTHHARVLVVAHVFYAEVWPDLRDRLARMPEPFDLIVTLVRGHSDNIEPEVRRHLGQARIHVMDNYGRDLASLVELSSMGMLDGYDAILKIHTKRSPHRLDGDGWRIELLDGVLASPSKIRAILELLRTDRSVGIVVPSGNLRGPETWGSDRELVEALAARIPFSFDPERLEYSAGSMYWARPWVLRRLADLHLSKDHFEPEAGHYDGSTAHALERFVGLITTTSGLDHVETHAVASRLAHARRGGAKRPPVYAFYLPQFHQIPENDAWWGEGFTDWRNVDAAQPLFEGHVQPKEPADLGHYDLTDPGALRQQAELASAYGIDGFVLYQYWFDGKTVLDAPLRLLLSDPSIEMPFAVCWANENWTKRWDGLDSEVLLKQTYSEGWAERYFSDVVELMRDPRYIRIDGKPLLVIYRIGEVPRAKEVITAWKARAAEAGIGGLHVLAVVPSRDFTGPSSDVNHVIDGWVRFPPGSGIELRSLRGVAPMAEFTSGDVFSYDAAVDGADLSTTGPGGLPLHPCVMPGWDNTPRRGPAGYVFHGSNPMSFRRWLDRAIKAAAGSDRMVFVNAWNEWAEGAYLEPDVRFGRANLEAVRDVVGPRAPTRSDNGSDRIHAQQVDRPV